ncbi:glutamate 5-kinase [Alterisphingorhabdus coralli]|uniref:Glutamate 5-kinase n=1 Tax=Alterisphingorhabdus coralli TaxID=3071408 RepID=A0AA97F7C2_9SPHN|nr:glutamate 5-kinase [Parasphingorhabdus sp. SCSIO 66989]WOE75714.1 glutamate 5-kinase [Parasphingorhabdus sp. SCSIO 66989]
MVADLTAARFAPEHCPRLVIKIGSSLLVDDSGALRESWMQSLCADIAERIKAGQKLIIVCSGAIALGARRLGLAQGGRATLADAQAAAAVGQIALSRFWQEALSDHGFIAAQILLTLDDMEDRRRYLNATATLERLMETQAVPVINENDSVATEEIRFGDNDRLAASVAQAVRAGGLLLMSDVDGLYTANPAKDSAAKRIATVETIDSSTTGLADDGEGSLMGTGGMASKLAAAKLATEAGIATAIISGRHDHPLQHFTKGDSGTIFAPSMSPKARKSWLASRQSARGTITVDDGAVRALLNGASLLAAGITAIEGEFLRGDLIRLCGTNGTAIAQGLSEYDADVARKVMGRRSEEHQAILGTTPRRAVVHRDHMVLL